MILCTCSAVDFNIHIHTTYIVISRKIILGSQDKEKTIC